MSWMLPRVRAGPAGSRFSHEAAAAYHSLQNPRRMQEDCKDSRNPDSGCQSRPSVGARCRSGSPCSCSFMPCRDWEILVEPLRITASQSERALARKRRRWRDVMRDKLSSWRKICHLAFGGCPSCLEVRTGILAALSQFFGSCSGKTA